MWSLELSVQHVRTKFEIEYGTSIEDFLDSVYLAGADLAGSDIEHHAKCIERSHKMLKLLDSAIELLRTKHKNGEAYTQAAFWHSFWVTMQPGNRAAVFPAMVLHRWPLRPTSFSAFPLCSDRLMACMAF